jgi:molybdopterin biosynthesis enzyme MoaB
MALDGRQGGNAQSVGDAMIVGIVTVSDRASSGVYKDESGPAIVQVSPADQLRTSAAVQM